jgi:hypothetical protein
MRKLSRIARTCFSSCIGEQVRASMIPARRTSFPAPWMVVIALMTLTALVYLTREPAP